ncbi:MAG: efflux transporter outer membrane subunit [Phycisphaerae bacterium]|nr:efflux transporter outer membrane subunit [Phycisphaerae bacterium]
MPRYTREYRCGCALSIPLLTTLMIAGCRVGPNYTQPSPRLQQEWMDAGQPGIQRGPAELAKWWEGFNDPVLNDLVTRAYQNSPPLLAAAVRVLQAQAARGIAVGYLFPQRQEATGGYSWNQASENSGAVEQHQSKWASRISTLRALQAPLGTAVRNAVGDPSIDPSYSNWAVTGLSVGWELDIWSRFRHGIEAADAAVLASVATYDDVLVSLIAEVATNYVQVRTLEEQLDIVRQNCQIQKDSLAIVQQRREGGTATELDVAQAQTLLHDTEAQIPATEASIRQTRVALCVLLGMPPQDITQLLGEKHAIPAPPESIAVSVPAELLRRRPDIRRAERQLAAQNAYIGIAFADFYPSFSLAGDIGLSAEHFEDLWRGNSFQAFAGPSFRWAVLNYGRIENNVRVQDAAFQAAISDYEGLVLRAQGEVESAIAGLVGAQHQIAPLTGSTDAASRAVNVATQQYKGGIADYIRVLVAQQNLITEQSRLISTRGSAAQNMITLYRALGGGWELRQGNDLVPTEIKDQMRKRTNWGAMIDADRVP